MGYFEKRISGEKIFNGKIIDVCLDVAELDNGKRVRREVVNHPGGVGIVPLDGDGFVYMVRQYRYPISQELLEIPAGKLEYSEDPYECAVRELSEETGLKAGKAVYLGGIYSSPGFCSEMLHIYLATELEKGKMHLDEDEFLNVEKYKLDDLLKMVMDNKITDGKTVIGILKTVKYLESL